MQLLLKKQQLFITLHLQFGEKCYHEIVTVQAIALNDEDGQQ